MNKQQLASRIWESANKMRSKIEANEYKDYILGFIFYKYLSDTELRFCRENGFTDAEIKALSEEDKATVQFIQRGIGYFIAHDNLFTTWISQGRDFDVSNVTDALSAFSRLIHISHKKVFDRILDTLQTGLSKLGDTQGSRTKAISDLLYLIKDIPMDGKQDYDVLGFIYEYLISNFAANAGKKAGEFYTPHEVSLLISEIAAYHLRDRQTIDIYDSTSGSGSLLINIGHSVAKHITDPNSIKYYAQEIKENTYNLTRMNLIMRGINPSNIHTRNGDTLEDDWPFFDENDPVATYNPLYCDVVVSNPPYSQAWDPTDKRNDPRYSGFGLAPKTKADFAFLLHDLYHLKPDGIMLIVLPHGVLFRGGEEGEIRKNLIEKNHIDAIIGLPANIFFGTGIPTIVMVLKRKRVDTDVLIIDASKGFAKVGKNNQLRASDIKRIVDTVVERRSIEKYSCLVSQQLIRDNEYNLNIPRYVDSSQSAETWDIYASMFGGIPQTEISLLQEYWQAFASLKPELFTDDGTPFSSLAVKDIKAAVLANRDVNQFLSHFASQFDDLRKLLRAELLEDMLTLDINKKETQLADAIFLRLANIPLVDKYNAYQILDDEWLKTAIDLEIIQTEGFATTKRVNPNMVMKTKKGREEEVQEGWAGHIIPFELVQATLLKAENDELKAQKDRLAEISAAFEEIIDTLLEEDKEELLNEGKDTFVSTVITKKIKELYGTVNEAKKATLALDEDAFERKLVLVINLLEEEKSLKATVRDMTIAIHNNTKATIESLTDAEVLELLEQKWLNPLLLALQEIPKDIIAELIDKISALADKYSNTFAEVATEIAETKAQLAMMIDDLTGSDFDMLGLRELQVLLRGEK